MDEPKGAKWIDHKGKRILVCDGKNLSKEEFEESILNFYKWAEEQIMSNNFNKGELRMLADSSNSTINDKALQTGKRLSKMLEPYTLKNAMVGVTGPKKIMFILINAFSKLDAKVFDDVDKALDWLAED